MSLRENVIIKNYVKCPQNYCLQANIHNQMSVDKMSLDKMSVDKMSVGKMSVNKMSLNVNVFI